MVDSAGIPGVLGRIPSEIKSKFGCEQVILDLRPQIKVVEFCRPV